MSPVPECVRFAGNEPRYNAEEFPCEHGGGDAVPVPVESISNSGKFFDSPRNIVPIFVVSRDFSVRYKKFEGFVGAGALLYKATDQTKKPSDNGYLWPKDAIYTWFLIDPKSCVSGGKVFDCSQPIPLQDGKWRTAPLQEQRQTVAASTSVSALDWEIGGISFGMSPQQVRQKLEARSLRVVGYPAHYRFNHPVSGQSVADTTRQMVGAIEASSVSRRDSVDLEEERMLIMFTPSLGGEKAYAVFRGVVLKSAAKYVPFGVFRAGVEAKYGSPVLAGVSSPVKRFVHYWSPSGGVSALKAWNIERDLPGVAIECVDRARQPMGVGIFHERMSPLTPALGVGPIFMEAHCGKQFLVSVAGVSADNLVDGYNVSMYDGVLAAQGFEDLLAAKRDLEKRAREQLAEQTKSNRPTF